MGGNEERIEISFRIRAFEGNEDFFDDFLIVDAKCLFRCLVRCFLHERMNDVYDSINEHRSINPHMSFDVSYPFATSMIAVGDNTVKVWDAVTGRIWAALKSRVKLTLVGHSNWVRSVAISHDGATIVSGSGE